MNGEISYKKLDDATKLSFTLHDVIKRYVRRFHGRVEV
jgi:hypothetical protein